VLKSGQAAPHFFEKSTSRLRPQNLDWANAKAGAKAAGETDGPARRSGGAFKLLPRISGQLAVASQPQASYLTSRCCFTRRCLRIMFALKYTQPITRVACSYRALRKIRLVAHPYSTDAPSYEHILVSTPKPGVGLSMFVWRSFWESLSLPIE
jgi:hypothetical protein